MKSISLSIIDKVDKATLAIYQAVHDAAAIIGIDCLIVGATARDIIFEIAFGQEIKRATRDIDFAIHVENWNKFTQLTDILIEKYGFTPNKLEHRLNLPSSGLWIDIIPFGAIADENDKYRWPGDPDTEFSIIGFQEAMDTAILCQVSTEPELKLKVVHPAVLVMLKIFSWRDRRHIKTTDAQDVAYAMSRYIFLDNNQQRLDIEPELFEGNFDPETVGARLVGRDLKVLAPGYSLDALRELVQAEIDLGDSSHFLADMQLGSRLLADINLYSHLLPNLLQGIDDG